MVRINKIFFSVYTFDLSGHNIKHTISKRRKEIPARHRISPVTIPTKNNDKINDNAAHKNRTI